MISRLFPAQAPVRVPSTVPGELVGWCGLAGAVGTRGGVGAPPTAYQPRGRGASKPRLDKNKKGRKRRSHLATMSAHGCSDFKEVVVWVQQKSSMPGLILW
jgi:hypothetical protein